MVHERMSCLRLPKGRRCFEVMIRTGYYIEESVISSSECDRLLIELDSFPTQGGRAGTRNLMSCEPVRELATDLRLLRIVEKVHGSAMLPFKATLFSKSGNANWLVSWHQDRALPVERFEKRELWGATSKKAGVLFAQAPASALSKVLAVRIHLDASTQSNGPLRVLPGSNGMRILGSREIDEMAHTTSSVECLVGRGGILAMSPLLLHASSKSVSDEPRRVLHIEYAETRDLEPGIRLAIA